ncbi:MAG: hypothetical protein A3K10_09820 [Bacteroidetes bacterium RIFCSPLOWO2_12_FULL_31_6]|nr:MAG: hypothetical protein A3K10_09820 [Bacteroidetes bacterium RIFCSPLOWO2_12_FULL_31_6]
MNSWGLLHIKYLSEKSNQSVNIGQTPLEPKYEKTFVNFDTGEIRVVNDLQSKQFKKKQLLNLFIDVYSKHLLTKSISILTCIVYQKDYLMIGKFINTITKKLKRKGVERLGYIWVRDIGDIKLEKHYHIIIATTRIGKKLFKILFHKKKHSNYEVQFKKTERGMIDYLIDKDLFAASKQRTYGKSRKFPIPLKK